MNVGVDIPDPTVSADRDASPPPLRPQILWPGLTRNSSARPDGWVPCDLDAFPEALFLAERHRRGEGRTHLPSFKAHVQGALRRVLIADTYLLCGGETAEAEVLSWFPDGFEASTVMIACGGVKPGRDSRLFKNRIEALAERLNTTGRGRGARALQLEVRFTLDPNRPPYLHDRFAVVDDELWHFGATVGGLHHKVNAATRGWNATSAQAKRFFDEVWRQPAAGGARTACDRGLR